MGPCLEGPHRTLSSKINYDFIQVLFFYTFLYIHPLLLNYLFIFPKKWALQCLSPGPFFLNPPLPTTEFSECLKTFATVGVWYDLNYAVLYVEPRNDACV